MKGGVYRMLTVHWLVSDYPWGFFDGRLYGHYEKKAIRFIRLDLLCGRKGSE